MATLEDAAREIVVELNRKIEGLDREDFDKITNKELSDRYSKYPEVYGKALATPAHCGVEHHQRLGLNGPPDPSFYDALIHADPFFVPLTHDLWHCFFNKLKKEQFYGELCHVAIYARTDLYCFEDAHRGVVIGQLKRYYKPQLSGFLDTRSTIAKIFAPSPKKWHIPVQERDFVIIKNCFAAREYWYSPGDGEHDSSNGYRYIKLARADKAIVECLLQKTIDFYENAIAKYKHKHRDEPAAEFKGLSERVRRW